MTSASHMPKFKSTGRRLDEPPADPQYFRIVVGGHPYGHEPSVSERTYHVCAHNEAEAQEVVGMLEKQQHDWAQEQNLSGPTQPWQISRCEAATQDVAPDA